RVGPFSLADCAPLEQLTTAADIQHRLRPPQLLIADLPTIRLSPEQVHLIRNGIPLQFATPLELTAPPQFAPHLELATPLESVPSLRSERAVVHPTALPQRLIAADEQHQLVAVLEQTDPTTARYRSLRVFHSDPDIGSSLRTL